MKRVLILSIVAVFAFGCSTEEAPAVEAPKETGAHSEATEPTSSYKPTFTYDTLNYKGYIGDAAVTAQFIIRNTNSQIDFQDSVRGVYSYDAYNNDIQLTGFYGCLDWCQIRLNEKVNGKSTGEWKLEADYLTESIKGTWKDPKTGKEAPIALKNIESSIYLHPKAKTFFESKAASERFFKKHVVHQQDMRFKRYYLLANSEENGMSYDSEKQYDFPLPVGLRLFFDNAGTYSDGPISIAKDWRIQADGFDVPYDSLFPKRTEIDYEVTTFIFEHVEPSVIYSAKFDMSAFSMSMEAIEKLGYHLVDEISWVIGNSDRVFGFFPNIEKLMIHEKADSESTILLDLDNAQEGHIAVREAKLIGTDWWGKVEYIYYDEVPCSSEVLVPKPTVYGWIRLYDEDGELTLDHYSRGC